MQTDEHTDITDRHTQYVIALLAPLVSLSRGAREGKGTRKPIPQYLLSPSLSGERKREREKESARESENGRVREFEPVRQTDRPQFSHSLALWLKKSITCLVLGWPSDNKVPCKRGNSKS